MANVTFVIEDALLRDINSISARQGTSANALVRDYFAHLARSGLNDQDRLSGNEQALFDYSLGKISRTEAKGYLGVDDRTFTDMLRHAGFPPPRATIENEDAMLERMKDISFK